MPPVCPMSAVALWWVADWVHSCKRLLGWSSALLRGGGSTGRMSSACGRAPSSAQSSSGGVFLPLIQQTSTAVSPVVMHYVTGLCCLDSKRSHARHSVGQGWGWSGTGVQFTEVLILQLEASSVFTLCLPAAILLSHKYNKKNEPAAL